jgi:arginine N-succinyltransferase
MATQVIAQVHPQTFLPLVCLKSEGLCYQGYVDIFDAGPTLEANSDELRAVKESHTCASKLSMK